LVREMAQMCALCALGFFPKEFFGLGGLFSPRLRVLVIGGPVECAGAPLAGGVVPRWAAQSLAARRGKATLVVCRESEAAWASRSSVRCSLSAGVGSPGEVMPASGVSIMIHHTYHNRYRFPGKVLNSVKRFGEGYHSPKSPSGPQQAIATAIVFPTDRCRSQALPPHS
jgi:hypothetical protein